MKTEDGRVAVPQPADTVSLFYRSETLPMMFDDDFDYTGDGLRDTGDEGPALRPGYTPLPPLENGAGARGAAGEDPETFLTLRDPSRSTIDWNRFIRPATPEEIKAYDEWEEQRAKLGMGAVIEQVFQNRRQAWEQTPDQAAAGYANRVVLQDVFFPEKQSVEVWKALIRDHGAIHTNYEHKASCYNETSHAYHDVFYYYGITGGIFQSIMCWSWAGTTISPGETSRNAIAPARTAPGWRGRTGARSGGTRGTSGFLMSA